MLANFQRVLGSNFRVLTLLNGSHFVVSDWLRYSISGVGS